MRSQAIMLERIMLVMSSDLPYEAGVWKLIFFTIRHDCNKKIPKFRNYFPFIETFCKTPNFRQSHRRQ